MSAQGDGRVALQGSERAAREGAAAAGPVDPSEAASVSVYVRRRSDAAPLPDPPRRIGKALSRPEFARRYGAEEADLDAVASFGAAHGLAVALRDAGRRVVVLGGTLGQLSAAFRVTLARYEAPGVSYRGYDGQLSVPSALEGIVAAAVGLDNRPIGRSATIVDPHHIGTSPNPLQVAQLYDFPAGADGSGQTIALLEFSPGRDGLPSGYSTASLDAFFQQLGLPTPEVVTAPLILGAPVGYSGTPSLGNVETMLDIEVAGAVAPGAKIVVYFAPDNEQGWVDGISTALHDAQYHADMISISWGEAESLWPAQAISNFDICLADSPQLGVTVLASTGDDGTRCYANDGKTHVAYPASSPLVLACGGTMFDSGPDSDLTEVSWVVPAQGSQAWSATGGGISLVHTPAPLWQALGASLPKDTSTGAAGRGVPDVAGYANGYGIFVGETVNNDFLPGGVQTIGGTSSVAPLYAGLLARVNEILGEPVGWINEHLYRFDRAVVFNDVTKGQTNGAPGLPYFTYSPAPGWDACTGLGSIKGVPFLTAIRGVGTPPGLAAMGSFLWLAWKAEEFDDRIFESNLPAGGSWQPQSVVTAANPALNASAETASGVSLAATSDGTLHMAFKGAFGDQFAYWTWRSPAGVWQPPLPIDLSGISPSLAAAGDTLYVAYRSDTSQSICCKFRPGISGEWTTLPPPAGPEAVTSVCPSLGVLDGTLYMAWKGGAGDASLYWSVLGSSGWAPTQKMGTAQSTFSPALAGFGGRMCAAWKGNSDQSIWWGSLEGGHWSQAQVSGVGGTSVGPALAVQGNELYMVWKGESGDQSLYSSRLPSLGAAWSPQQHLPFGGSSPDV